MASGDIKQKIVLEGEKQYSAALKEAQRNLKVLRSELKAETAELGKNATEQQKNETRVKNLQKQIKEQEKVVRTYEKALEEVREKYGDNEEAIAKWEIKLNEARAALGKMKDGLNDTGKSMQNVGSSAQMSTIATNSLADSLGKVANAAGSIGDAIENAFSGIVNKIHETISAVWGELMDIAAKSDNYMDLAAYFGSSATEVQKWDSAMKAAAGDMSTVTNLITRLKYSGKEKSVAEWFGISAENYTNDLEYFQAVMQQMVDSREEMKKAGTWDTAMADIFGTKKGFDVEGILSDWGAILDGLHRFNADEGGYGLTEEQIQNMADLNVQVLTLKESWESLKRMALVHLTGDLALKVTGNLQNIVDAFKEYFQADSDEEREAALDKIRENLEEMFKAIAKAVEDGIAMLGKVADNLKTSEDPMVRAFGEFLEKIVNVMEWAVNPDNWDTIKKGFEAIIGIWVGTKVIKALSNLASFVSHIKTIWQYNNGGGTPTAPTTLPTGGNPTTVPTVPKGTGGGGGVGGIGIEGIASLGELALIAALVYDTAATVIETGKEMDENNKKYTAYYESASSAYSGSEYYKMWDSLYGYLYAKGEGNESYTAVDDMLENVVHEYMAFINGEKENPMLDRIIEGMSMEDYDRLQSVMEGLSLGIHYSGNEMEDEVLPALNQLLQLIMEDMNQNPYEIPADEWEGELTNNISNMNTLPGLMQKAVENGISKVKVTLDGHEVGVLVSPIVSQEIAKYYE